jgi:hypothetical protein
MLLVVKDGIGGFDDGGVDHPLQPTDTPEPLVNQTDHLEFGA